MGEWPVARLQDVCLGIFDCPHSTPALTDAGPYLVRTQDVRTGVLRLDQAAHVSERTYRERIERAEPGDGDLVFSREGTYFGTAAEIPPGARVCLGQRMVLIRPNPELVVPKFLRYWLNSPASAAHVHAHRDGSVAERLNLPTIRDLPVPVPPLATQARIAGILGVLDNKIELNREMVQTLRRVALATGTAARGGAPVPLGAIADLQRGFGYSSAGIADSGTPMISMGTAERRGWLKRSGIRRYADPVKSKYHVGRWDLLVVNVDLTWKLEVLGWPLLVPSDVPDAVISNDIFAIRPHPSHAWKRSLIWAALQTPVARGWLEGAAKGTTVASVAASDVLALRIEIEDSSVARRLAATAEAAIERAWAAEREAEGLTRVRDTLLLWLLGAAVREDNGSDRLH